MKPKKRRVKLPSLYCLSTCLLFYQEYRNRTFTLWYWRWSKRIGFIQCLTSFCGSLTFPVRYRLPSLKSGFRLYVFVSLHFWTLLSRQIMSIVSFYVNLLQFETLTEKSFSLLNKSYHSVFRTFFVFMIIEIYFILKGL